MDGAAPPAADGRTLRPADERRLYEAIRGILAEAVERRGSSIDDYTAPDGDGAMQERLEVYQRTGEPCPRCGRPIRRIVVGGRATHFCSWCQRLPAADRAGAAAILRTMTGGAAASGPALDGARRARGPLGLTPGEAAQPAPRGRGRSARASGGDPAGGGAASAGRGLRGRLMSILRLSGRPPRGRHVRHPRRVNAAIALGDRVGLVGPNGAGKTTLLRIAAGLDEPDGGEVHRKRGLSLGLLAQESHFDAAFMAAPDLRTAVRDGAAHLERMATSSAELERAGRVEEPAYADLQHRFEVLGGYTLDQRVDEALSGLGFARDEWAGRRRRCRAASRPGRRWPGS